MPCPLLPRDRLVTWRGSSPASSPARPNLGAGPGCFQCAVALGATDAGMCEMLHEFLGIGRVHRYQRRRPHYDDEVVWMVRSMRELVETLVPFLDEHLPASYKREQYGLWRGELMTYWDQRARRPRPCIVDGCAAPRRAKDLCRRHYYQAYGR